MKNKSFASSFSPPDLFSNSLQARLLLLYTLMLQKKGWHTLCTTHTHTHLKHIHNSVFEIVSGEEAVLFQVSKCDYMNNFARMHRHRRTQVCKKLVMVFAWKTVFSKGKKLPIVVVCVVKYWRGKRILWRMHWDGMSGTHKKVACTC